MQDGKCLFCSAPITGDYRKKFCNRSHAASYNNSIKPKRKAASTTTCGCGALVFLKKDPLGGFYKRIYCESCLKLRKVFQLTAAREEDLFENQTKGSLYSRRKNWQSANSSIRNHSRKVYMESAAPKMCKICRYDKHFEVAHIKPVSEFPDEAKVLEINSIDNLVAYCRNHHWEFDNGVLCILD